MTQPTSLAAARHHGEAIVAALREAGVTRVEACGAARRAETLVDEIVVVAAGITPKRAAEALKLAVPDLVKARVRGEEVIVTLDRACPARVRTVRPGDMVKAVVAETGDDAHLAWLRSVARARKVPYARAAGRARSEDELYAALGLSPVPPELREGPAPKIPADLLAEGGLRGVFHVHTEWSDGSASIVEMARAARDEGFSYLGISDHSRAASYARGLDARRLEQQAAAIAEARREVPEMTILHGVEVDILLDGDLDLDDATLAALDFVIASVHTRFNLDERAMTARIVRAVSHPLVTMLGHPTGRLLPQKTGYAYDMARVAAAAAANDTCLEINANAHRLDLAEAVLREATVSGARFAINPDAHAPSGFRDTHLGVAVARRAGLAQHRVLNAADASTIVARLRGRKTKALARLGRAARA